MKILITGGCGFIGSTVVRRALGEGFAVVNVDAITYAGDPDNIGDLQDSPRYAFEYADVCDAEAMAMIFQRHQPDAVLHLAAESHVDRSIDGPLGFVRTNVTGTATLLEAARAYLDKLPDSRRKTFRFHHVSTDEVYGALGEEGVFDEQSPYAPNSPYSASKAASDMMVRAWGKTYGLPVVITNTSNNYGPFQHPEKLIPTVIVNALEGRPIPLYGRGTQVRDWLYVEDHAGALLRVLTRGRVGETYCIGGEAERSNLELVKIVCAVLDQARPRSWPHADLIRFVSDRPGHDFRYAISNAKIAAELGFRPSVDLETGIARTVRWYLDHEAWWGAIRERGFKGQRLGLKRA
ncbi:dTDP-glucose 4,6-dehydratase [Caulobacter sp. KR2-114]|uniref:dTDP-glucose 4,6-dehydratase n=1 Tax=Caulobacter sp. KR2-114 TaxID=3400912 RepID=UPI003C0DA04F